IHGADPFTLFYQPTVTTIGAGTSFGGGGVPESGYWDVFKWINPQTREDPEQREGFFFTTATIALKSNASGAVAVLVPRRPVSSMITYYANGACPPEANECTNVVP